MRRYLVFFSFIISFSILAIAAEGQNVTSKEYEFIATVNGTPISKSLFDLSLQGMIAQGQKDTPQLRDSTTQQRGAELHRKGHQHNTQKGNSTTHKRETELHSKGPQHYTAHQSSTE